MTPDDLTSRAQGEAERLRPVTGVADDTERRDNLLWGAGYVTGAAWAAAQAPSVEALTADYNCGWHDAMKAAHESVGTYLGYPSANGVLGFGPDAVIVDGDWLKVQMDERDALTAQIDRLRAGVSRALAIGLHERPAEAGDVLSRALLAEDEGEVGE